MASAIRISRLPAAKPFDEPFGKLCDKPSSDLLLDDNRFHALLSDADWGRLPLAIWRRFSKRHADGSTVVYVGEVEEAYFNRIGWWLAQLARLIGGPRSAPPLPRYRSPPQNDRGGRPGSAPAGSDSMTAAP